MATTKNGRNPPGFWGRLWGRIRRWEPATLILIVLAVLSAGAVGLHWLALRANEYWAGMLDSMAIELVGAVVTTLVLSVPFSFVRSADRRRLRRLGLERVRTALASWCWELMDVYIAADPTGARIANATALQDFFGLEFFKYVGALNLRLPSYQLGSETDEPLIWGQVIAKEGKHTTKLLTDAHTQFGQVFDVAFYERVVRFSRSDFFAIADQLPWSLRRINPQLYRSLDELSFTNYLKENVAALIELIDEYNELVDDDQGEPIEARKLWDSFFTGPLSRIAGVPTQAPPNNMEVRPMNAPAPPSNAQQRQLTVEQHQQFRVVDRFDLPYSQANVVFFTMEPNLLRLQFDTIHVGVQPGAPVRFPVARIAMTIEDATRLSHELAKALADRAQAMQQFDGQVTAPA